MKKFSFALEGVLKYRRHREELLLEELGALQRTLREAEHVLALRREEQRTGQDEMRQALRGRINLDSVQLTRDYLLGVAQSIRRQVQVVAGARADLEECRQRLVVAMADRKVMEKLREKALDAYQQEYWREEQAFLDDVAATAASRSSETGQEVR